MKKIVASSLLLASLASVVWSDPPSATERPADKAEAKPAPTKRKPHFTVSKETTYVTKPLDADGYIDYAAALHERLHRGVTPDNNAVVLLWKAFGPHPERTKMPAEFFKWLEIDPPPERGDYFIDLGKYVKERRKLDQLDWKDPIFQEQTDCSHRAWKAARHPEIAAWLKANEKPLALVIEASNRSQYYSPLAPKRTEKGSSGLFGALLPGVQKCRELANALTIRAMLHLGEGRIDDAWRDLLACHRLGRLVGRGPTLIEGLVGIAIDSIASNAEVVFLADADLKTEQIRKCLNDLRKLPPMPSFADKIDVCERFMFLDVVMMVERNGLKTLEGLAGGTPNSSSFLDKITSIYLRTSIDWDPSMRTANRWYDRVAKALRVEDFAERRKQLDKIDKELKDLTKKTRESMPQPLQIIFGKDSSKIVSEWIGNVLVGLLMPAVLKVQQARDRCDQMQANLYLAFALAAYRCDNGSYPKNLEALMPKYMDKIPNDLFSGKPLVYKPDEKGYLLYSVGVNGSDDGGRDQWDTPPADDLRVRMPPPKPSPK